jgi:hypothetical protein
VPKPDSILAEDEEIERYPIGIPAESIRIVPVTEVFEDESLLGSAARAQ